ncbi:MAG: hypothetical protein JXA71_00165, partial [Chitinispirillaceae bacterium]|nr:hypothetical protein [Chitinispirillaceae bacterium]
MPSYRTLLTVIVLLVAGSFAQPAFVVTALEGPAKIQRSSKQKWEKLVVGSKVADNDMVETFFQTRLTLALGGRENAAVIGSNSKALFSIALKAVSNKKEIETSLSLFNGGLFIVMAKRMRVSVFSTSAVAEIDSGSAAVIVDGKTGETGVLVLGGTAMTRNISQQKGRELTTGNTTVLVPGREPSPPLHVTFRHVAVLKHFFGDNYITDVLQSAAITPADDRGGGKVMLSDGVSQPRPQSDALFYKRLFDLNRIYGSILEDREQRHFRYAPITPSQQTTAHRGSLTLRGGGGTVDGMRYPSLSLVPEIRYPYLDAGLRFRVANNYRGETVFDFVRTAGILDKIHHITVGSISDSLFLTVGPIERLTLGQGLVVDRFRNTDNNRISQPLGLNGRLRLGETVSIGAFLAEVTDPTLGGVHIGYDPSIYYFGAGYYFDRNQYPVPASTSDIRYTRSRSGTSLFPDTATVAGNVAMYELGFGAAVTENHESSLRVFCDFAQKRLNGRSDGHLLRAPSLFFSRGRWSAEGGMLFESGRAFAYEFNEFYRSRRSYYKCAGGADTTADTLLTFNSSLWDRRRAVSMFFGAGVNPMKGIDLSAKITRNIKARNAYVEWKPVDSTTDTMRISPKDFSLDIRISVDRTVSRFVTYAGIYARQA